MWGESPKRLRRTHADAIGLLDLDGGLGGLKMRISIYERRLLNALFLALETSQLFNCGQDEATVDVHGYVSTWITVSAGSL